MIKILPAVVCKEKKKFWTYEPVSFDPNSVNSIVGIKNLLLGTHLVSSLLTNMYGQTLAVVVTLESNSFWKFWCYSGKYTAKGDTSSILTCYEL